MKKIYLLYTLMLMFIMSTDVFAVSSYFTGSSSAGEGSKGSISFYVNGAGTTVGTVGGYFSSSNSSCIYITSVSGSSNNVGDSRYKFAYVDFGGTGFSGSKMMATINYEVRNKSCSSTIIYSDDSSSDINANTISVSGSSHNINVLSNDNNLMSLSVTEGNINFSQSTTSYSFTVDSGVTNVNVSATAVQGASVSGTGNKNLNYGSNKINVIVTAESGAKKTYTINVTRKDDRSNENNLKNLNVSSGSLSPSFDSNVINYTLLIPFEEETIDVNAIAKDSNAKVSVSGNSGFISEETKDVTITVTAENGSVKTYTIAVTRGKDPNKPLSEVNTLASLSIDAGILSPAFDKNKTEYLVWLPFEVENINIDFSLEDSKWASYEYIKPDVLEVGANEYKIIVTAENKEVKTYVVTVMRGYSAGTNEERDSLLKNLKLTNGSLTSDFKSDNFVYTYKSKENFIIEATANYEDSKIVIHENEGIYTIYVEDINGSSSAYSLKPYKFNYLIVILPIVFVIVILIFTLKKVIKNNKDVIKVKKGKKVREKNEGKKK